MQKLLFLIPCLKTLLKGRSKKSLHFLSVKTAKGENTLLEVYKNKKLLVVNTASECGYTPQYRDLEELYKRYSGRGLVILAFPCNDFGNQEPDELKNIELFCSREYNLSFGLMEKITTKGESAYPLFKWLSNKKENGVLNSKLLWNFQKYLVDENGCLVDVLPPWKTPLCREILNWLDRNSKFQNNKP